MIEKFRFLEQHLPNILFLDAEKHAEVKENRMMNAKEVAENMEAIMPELNSSKMILDLEERFLEDPEYYEVK